MSVIFRFFGGPTWTHGLNMRANGLVMYPIKLCACSDAMSAFSSMQIKQFK